MQYIFCRFLYPLPSFCSLFFAQIIQVVNHAHNVKLFHFTFALPNPLNGYVGAEIAEPVCNSFCLHLEFVSFCFVFRAS